MLPAPAAPPIGTTSGAARRPGRGARWSSGALAVVVSVLLAGLAVAVPASPAAATGPGTATILSQLNASRAGAGLRPLALAGDLSAVAYAWSQHLASSGVLAHNPNLTSQVGDWQVLGENVGYGPTVTDVETAFMNSPRHRANILEPRYTQIGLGVVVDASGTAWVTQVFRKPMSSSAPAASSSTTSTTPSAARTSTPLSTAARSGTSTRPATAVTSRPRPTGPVPAAPLARPTVPAPSAAPTASAAPTPDVEQLLAQRLAAAAQARPGTAGDPIDAALGWAAAMDALAG